MRPESPPVSGDVPAAIVARLDWDYRAGGQDGTAALYARAVRSPWHVDRDLDWSVEVPFGEPLPAESAFAQGCVRDSELGRLGPATWNALRWEFQAWLVSQFLHGEHGALIAAARLVEVVPGAGAKLLAASQVADEARHVEAFARYLDAKLPTRYEVSQPLAALIRDTLTDPRWDITALGMQIMVEALAMATFRLADRTFHDRLIREICRLVARDEARHVSFGILSLQEHYAQLTAAERREREDFVLEGAHLMSRRFLLTEVWERLGVDPAVGRDFARTNRLMVAYRQAVFAKVVTSVQRIGLLSPRVRDVFGGLDLVAATRVPPGASD